MSALTADIGTLQAYANDFKRSADATTAIRPTLQRIVDAWELITTAVSDVGARIAKAEDDERDAMWSELQEDLDCAREAWFTTLADVAKVDLDLKATDAKIVAGMSSQQVAAAVAARPTMALTAYIAAA